MLVVKTQFVINPLAKRQNTAITTMSWLFGSGTFDPATYEKQLATISRKITRQERKRSTLQHRLSSSKHFIMLHGTISYLVVAMAILFQARFSVSRISLRQAAVIIGSPLLLLALYKLIRLITLAQINRTETYLESLKESHAVKIEELKEKTKYASTAALLNRFSEGTDKELVLDEEIQRKQELLQQLETLSKKQQELAQSKKDSKKKHTWFDSIVDVLNGSTTDVLSAENRYALICHVCHHHNGLAPPGLLPENVKYVCPRCREWNGADSVDTIAIPESTNIPESSVTAAVEEPSSTTVEDEKMKPPS